MTSRTPPLRYAYHDQAHDSTPSYPPATAQNDITSNGSFSPWSDARLSNLTSPNRATPASGPTPGPPVSIDYLLSSVRARRGGAGRGRERGEPSTPCQFRPARNVPSYLDQAGSQSSQCFEKHSNFPGLLDIRLPDNITGSSAATAYSRRTASIDTIKPDATVRCYPDSSSFGVSVNSQECPYNFAVPSRSSGSLQATAATAATADAPIYYQPMSSLMSMHTPSQTERTTLGDMDLHNRHSTAFDHLTASMQRFGLNDLGAGLNNVEVGPVARVQRHFSPHYQGDIFLPANQSEDIPDDLNCSLFIVNLPPSLTTHELVAAIHKMGPLGRIFAIHINGPELQRNHPGCAAKVVFFQREVAQSFFTRCESSGFRVNEYHSRVMWNRIKTSEKSHLTNSDASRVLLIGGPPSIVNSSTLTDFFHTKLEFQIDNIITHAPGSVGNEDAVIEYRFGSFRCQSQAAKMALARELPHIRCFFGKDPLEPEVYRPFEYFNFTESV
ncbi:hypothetical protein N0V93_007679 [Gnomoniopsis smithogilvyi]|uniref:RRM domain-containing protein n=1 Tax=Gnomoniopsis smithogilvyi TaxID=1191159 RepID=A0A9W9CU23_9PEZI|nr:hypothetical protein N0V93_007679 [Gnomoniopsis smithogilvyi]